MRIIDSSVLLALYQDKDVHHSQALGLLNSIGPEEPLVVNDYIVNEVVTVALRKSGLDKSKGMLDVILNNRQFGIHHTSSEEFGEVVLRFKAQTSTLSFVDCSIICLSDSLGCPVETFDKPLAAELSKAHSAKRPGA